MPFVLSLRRHSHHGMAPTDDQESQGQERQRSRHCSRVTGTERGVQCEILNSLCSGEKICKEQYRGNRESKFWSLVLRLCYNKKRRRRKRKMAHQLGTALCKSLTRVQFLEFL